MKKIIYALLIVFSASAFALEKPDILDDYKIIVGMIEDIYANLSDLKDRQNKLENTFSKIRVVNRNESTSAINSQNVQLTESTREELSNNLR